MKKLILVLTVLTGLAFAIPARAQWGYQFSGLEYNWLMRNSSMLHDTYVQLEGEASFHPIWVNLTPGLELDFSSGQLTRYFLQEQINIPGDSHSAVVARLNHTEYKDWDVGVNAVNLYFTQRFKNLDWALGAAYISTNVGYHRDPLRFEEDLYQVRMLYSVAYDRTFNKNRSRFKIGAEDFTDFENYGYDQLGPFVELGWQVTDRTYLMAKGDFRIVGVGTATPHLERETYLLGMEWKNLPKKPKAATDK